MPSDETARTPKGRAPHRRNQDARVAVMHAADDLLVERGFGALTVEGIAARAGVAKQTIYRWWPSKTEVLLDTLVEDADAQFALEDHGAVDDDLRRYLRRLARFVARDPAGAVLLALLGEAQHDEAVAASLQARFLGPRRRRERERLRRAIADGELGSELDVDAAIDALVGPIVYRALVGQAIPRGFVDGLVARTIGPHLTATT